MNKEREQRVSANFKTIRNSHRKDSDAKKTCFVVIVTFFCLLVYQEIFLYRGKNSYCAKQKNLAVKN